MPEYQIPKSEKQFEENFSQIHPLMNATEAYYESSRCLFCFNAPCTEACPTKIDVPLFIRQINTENVTGAAKTIYDSNYFGGICGKVCPTEVLCEGACVLGNQHVKPIEIGRLQNYAVQTVIQKNLPLFAPGKGEKGKAAVIGAGPAGLSCACELRLLGYQVDIFEAEEFPSGLALFGIAPYKIENKEVLAEMKFLEEQFGLKIQYKQMIDTQADISRLEKEYQAVFLGIGLGETAETRLPGEDLPGCTGATEFIKELKLANNTVRTGRKVIVLGGGNTAMDAASEAARLGAEEITLAYRRSRKEKPAYDFEYSLAKGVGVKGLFNAAPVEILGTSSVEGVRFIRTTTVSGKVEKQTGSEFVLPCDMVIRATGQKKKTRFLDLINGLKTDEAGRIVTDPGKYQTDNPKFFAGGDAVNGGAEVVNAAFEGKAAAREIHNYLSGKEK